MKVSELAAELKSSPDEILTVLKALKLKSKDAEQELSSIVLSIVRNEYKNGKPTALLAPQPPPKPQPKAEIFKVKLDESEEPKPFEKKKVEPKVSVVAAKAKPKKEEKAKEEKVEKPAEPTKVAHKKPLKKIVKKTMKAATVSEDEAKAQKANNKIMTEPVITLKPLARKKRRGPEDFKQESNRPSDLSPLEVARLALGGGGTAVEETEVDAEPKILPEMEIKLPITVKDFSIRIGQKPSVVLTHLMKMGMLAHINQSMDGEIVERLTRDFGFKLTQIRTQEEQIVDEHEKQEENPELLKPRAPVVTFMGHVDHGKTSLIDRIRQAKVADSEHGGITQHMGAYSVRVPKGQITFLDTPGHEAFTAMRTRGAKITDLVVLVVAADEGVMPQTEEAINHARAAGVPIIVALNKIDKQTANPDRVKKQLTEFDLSSEDWGGKTVVVGVSATTGAGIDELLEMILLESEMLELKANPERSASGIVVEAHLSQGKGSVATLIVQRGTLREGDIIVVGPNYGKIKAMFNDHGKTIKQAGPSTPVEIIGLNEVPAAGEKFYVTEERAAREVTTKRQELIKDKRLEATNKITLEDLYSQLQAGAVKELNVIVKADVQGSLEALRDSLGKIPSDRVKVRFIHMGVGDVNTSDILLAIASKAIIIAFHVNVGPRAKEELERNPVDIRQYRIIYDAVDDMRKALEGLLEVKTKKIFQSKIEIRNVFKLSKSGIVAGCYVTKGKAQRKARMDIIRNDEIVYTGTLSSLKRFKDDVREVNEGMECGIQLDNYNDYQVGDIIETYLEEKIAGKL